MLTGWRPPELNTVKYESVRQCSVTGCDDSTSRLPLVGLGQLASNVMCLSNHSDLYCGL